MHVRNPLHYFTLLLKKQKVCKEMHLPRHPRRKSPETRKDGAGAVFHGNMARFAGNA